MITAFLQVTLPIKPIVYRTPVKFFNLVAKHLNYCYLESITSRILFDFHTSRPV